MSDTPLALTIVSHTHWDREWYRPFQDFRLRLVRLIDDVLAILDSDPSYHSFLLDGQTIILEDYLEMRPEREADLRRLIAEGRLLIGPWHILPDEFLVGPESTVRNLMLGARLCASFGARMPVGYTPDPFGHISQLPQILAGTGIGVAAFRRGLAEEPLEVWWEAPDGTHVLALYLREGYDNLQWAPTDPDAFVAVIERQIARMAPHTRSGHLLLLNGTDHMPPQPGLPALIREANERLNPHATLSHGTLPGFAAAVQAALDPQADLPVVQGELRSPRRHHLLPGVLSTRMWIKQRNHACETLLTRYAEPLTAFNAALSGLDRRGEVWRAWRYLIENHPHDSICGCSIDQVHDEMRTRFDWAEQIATGIVSEALQALGTHIDAAKLPIPEPDARDAPDFAVTGVPADLGVIVFNPTPGTRGEVVAIDAPWMPPEQGSVVYDADGNALLCNWEDERDPLLETRTLDTAEFDALLTAIEVGAYRARLIRDVRLWFDGDEARAEIVLTESHPRDVNGLYALARAVRARLAQRPIQRGTLTTYFAVRRTLTFHAPAVPGVGYRVFRLGSVRDAVNGPAPNVAAGGWLENEHLRLEVDPHDGTLILTDKATGRRYTGLNRLVDGGDRGDEYNYCPPERDGVVTLPALPPRIERDRDSLCIRLLYRLPVSLAPDRAARAVDTVDLPVVVTARLAPDARRVDIHTALDNRAQDHRLRALFPTGIDSDIAIVDGHFDRLRREPSPDCDTSSWIEQPQPTNAMRAYVAVERPDGGGLMLAARGLPEYELITENSGAALALTLLRCVGWLSREDFACRVGQAGPELATPGAQCLGAAAFDYSLIPYGAGDLDRAAAEAYAFEAPLRAALCVLGEGALEPQAQLLTLEPPALVLTAIKPAESGDALIVRFYNSSERAQTGCVTFGIPVTAVEPVNLLEEPHGDALTVGDGRQVTIDAPPKRIITWRVTLAR